MLLINWNPLVVLCFLVPASTVHITTVGGITAHAKISDYMDVSSGAANKPVQNIALTNVWEMQFYGTIAVGTPPQQVTVVFDTGSGLLVVKGKGCKLTGSSAGIRGASGGCQGGNSPGYDVDRSSSATPSNAPFASNYGSGSASGKTIFETVTAGGFKASHSWMSIAQREVPRFSGFKMDGIFGLSQQIARGRVADAFGTMCKHAPGMHCVFSLFLTPKQNAPGSQLTFGGYDSSKVKPGSVWQAVSAVKLPGVNFWEYWAMAASDFSVGDETFCRGHGACYAIVDSGTTFIGVPKSLWMKIRPLITKGKECQFDLEAFDGAVKCKHAKAEEFPTVSISFGEGSSIAHFKLTGKDYVECFTDGWCKPRLTISKLELEDNLFIFGIFFMRKYVTLFDHETRHILFADAAGYDKYLASE